MAVNQTVIKSAVAADDGCDDSLLFIDAARQCAIASHRNISYVPLTDSTVCLKNNPAISHTILTAR